MRYYKSIFVAGKLITHNSGLTLERIWSKAKVGLLGSNSDSEILFTNYNQSAYVCGTPFKKH